ncbi:nuclear transport factor 2 family protein [Streptomyces sp. NPDC055952]|uniref:nuclear transport factor 2 family protein n=1 Tax=Streptomyces sp. NPDC055952 TaxID=3345663 RepID=UPI0035DF50CD
MTAELIDTTGTLPGREFAALYAQAQQFYTHQMRLLDTHDTEQLTSSFTEDAVLELPGSTGPVPVRAQLARYVRAGAQRQRRAGGRLHHWVGKLDVRPRADGSMRTRCSALAYVTALDGGAPVLSVCVMEDVLVRVGGQWRITHRRVSRDDLA